MFFLVHFGHEKRTFISDKSKENLHDCSIDNEKRLGSHRQWRSITFFWFIWTTDMSNINTNNCNNFGIYLTCDRKENLCYIIKHNPNMFNRYLTHPVHLIFSYLNLFPLIIFPDIPEFLYSTTKNKELRFDIKLFTQCIATWDKDTEKNIYIGRFLALYV